MPWFKDANNEDKYKPSVYTNEDLPTWNEFFNDWWEAKIFSTDDSNLGFDTYYTKILRSKVLMAYACNQLNKMLYEDGILKTKFHPNLYLYFTLSGSVLTGIDTGFGQIEEIGQKDFPIYTIPNPNGTPNPFSDLSKGIRRKDITTGEFFEFCGMVATLRIPVTRETANIHHIPLYGNYKHKLKNVVLNSVRDMLTDVQKYFEGTPGWKDKDGNLIESAVDDKKLSCPSGFDPAL